MPNKISRVWWFLVLFVLIFALLAGLSIISTSHFWDGGFEQAEYRFTFRDRDKRPVEGVELRVTDSSGNPFPGYPISDYLPGSPLLSDVNGQLVCHHVRFGLLEFGGQAYYLFWLIPVGEVAPVFRCHFLLRGEEVGSCDYRELLLGADHATEVLRSWDLGHYISEYEKVLGSQQDMLSGRDGNRDGNVSSSEYAAWNAFINAYEEYQDRSRRRLPLTEDRRFRVVERNIVLDRGTVKEGETAH